MGPGRFLHACPDEANQFFDYVSSSAAGSLNRGGALQIMFGIGGVRDLTERELPHLEDWRHSAPGPGGQRPGNSNSSTATASCSTGRSRREHLLDSRGIFGPDPFEFGGHMRSDIREGETFPNYELADQSGRRRSLSELQGGNPMVLHLSRGGFDPKEHQFVGQLVDVYPEFRNAYTRLALISTDNQLNINEFRDALGATWPFLSDPDRIVQKDLDIKEFTDEPHDPMIPHTFVLEPGLKIFKIYNGYWYWGRPTMAELHVDLRGVFKKIRPDFDLAAPGLRDAWERGDRDQFLVDTLEEPIRYTEGKSIGIKR
jgi:peroxiredoxin